MDFTEKRKTLKYGFIYCKCAYSEGNDINTEQLIFVSLKIKKKKERKKKEIKKISLHPDRGTLERQRCVVPLSYVNIGSETQ